MISTRFGCDVELISPIYEFEGNPEDLVVDVKRTSDGKVTRNLSVGYLRADGGWDEIQKASDALITPEG